MSRVEEQLSEQFRRWELRGRGSRLYDEPVHPEPPFSRFDGHHLPAEPVIDDGRRPTFLSSLVQRLSAKLSTEKLAPPAPPEPEEEPEPTPLFRGELSELVASLPGKLDVSRESFEQFLLSLSLCREPVAFELLGAHGKVVPQFAAHPEDAPLVSRQLRSFFPEAVFVPGNRSLERALEGVAGDEPIAAEFGLAREFMLPLASGGKIDPFVGVVGALSGLRQGEIGLFQVIFQAVVDAAWPESILRSVTHADGKPFFVNRPELASAAESKISRPLFAAVVRIFVCTEEFDRSLQIARDIAGSLRVFAHPNGNELIPLTNDGYDLAEHIEDVLARQSRRTGMMLNSDELLGFVHIPSSAVRSPAFARQSARTKPAPGIVRRGAGLLLGENEHAGEAGPVRLTPDQRTHHVHIIGASGTGKSTLLFNLARQDIEEGHGLAVLDPRGDLIDQICGAVPPERAGDVILVDPSDPEYSVGFNVLSAHSELEKNLLASDLVAVFRRLSTSWGDQMNSVLQNAILAFLESDRKGTLADLRRFLIESPFRSEFLKSVRDPEVVYYWQKSFPYLTGGKSIGPILTRLDAFLAQKPIRHMVSQPENRLDFAKIMDEGRILLAKLPEGLLGRENSYLLGALLMSKFQQIVMSRQAQQIGARRDFWLYVDEFADFITPSTGDILKGARKYRLGLTLAHHDLQQLERDKDVASAVMSHPFTRIVFRVSDSDAKRLAEGFSHFEAKDVQNLEVGHAICRVERSDFDFNLRVPLHPPPDPDMAQARREEVITASRRRYAMARADVETLLTKSRTVQEPVAPPLPKEAKAAEPPAGTRSEKKIPEPMPVLTPANQPPPKAEARHPADPEKPRDLGRGGELHRTIQERIQREAHSLGFSSDREKSIGPSNEAADVVVRHGGFAMAVEIAVTTTVDHEFRNAKKCLEAGFARVAVVSPSPERLRRIAEAVRAGLGPKEAAKVTYHAPDDLIGHLRTLAEELRPRSQAAAPGEWQSHGRTVRTHVPRLSEAEQAQREDMVNRILLDATRGGRKP